MENETELIEPVSIDSDKFADFIINQNILKVPAQKNHKTKVLKTALQGITVYEEKKGGLLTPPEY